MGLINTKIGNFKAKAKKSTELIIERNKIIEELKIYLKGTKFEKKIERFKEIEKEIKNLFGV